MTKTVLSCVLVAGVLAAAGCGGSNKRAQTSASTTHSSSDSSTAQAILVRAVKRTIADNDRVSGQVLWTNIVPVTAARSTGGPALQQLRSAAATRRRQGIHIRTVGEQRRVLSIALDPSYASAIAVVHAREQLVPYRGNTKLGRAIHLDEHARIELRRVDSSNRFRVWKVSLVK